jgi:hypothetical protein
MEMKMKMEMKIEMKMEMEMERGQRLEQNGGQAIESMERIGGEVRQVIIPSGVLG